uniref:Uncharacterized protein n=1 Tax=Picea glauca TaxID=3330 RepID=A0A101LU93_PICGL|nr:hypothetical protein ABT39_MTgene3449 [Picea glauca]QHR87691.1 hypothetical protein Q903MT_gene1703 [Picea sitchensis]
MRCSMFRSDPPFDPICSSECVGPGQGFGTTPASDAATFAAGFATIGWLALERRNTRLKFMGLELGEMLLSLPFTLDHSNLHKLGLGLGRIVYGLREGGPTLLDFFMLDRQLATLDRLV